MCYESGASGRSRSLAIAGSAMKSIKIPKAVGQARLREENWLGLCGDGSEKTARILPGIARGLRLRNERQKAALPTKGKCADDPAEEEPPWEEGEAMGDRFPGVAALPACLKRHGEEKTDEAVAQ